jgi:hypothetical protein
MRRQVILLLLMPLLLSMLSMLLIEEIYLKAINIILIIIKIAIINKMRAKIVK